MPPMDMNQPDMMGGQGENMDMGMNMPQGDEMEGGFSEDGNGEENTPKKEIQKLTGSLSQELRTYNDSQQEPDTELNKYVASMILKQAGKSLTSKDRDEVIKKMDGGDSEDSNETNDMPMESIKKTARKIVNEILNDSLIDGERKRENKKSYQQTNFRNPFQSNR